MDNHTEINQNGALSPITEKDECALRRALPGRGTERNRAMEKDFTFVAGEMLGKMRLTAEGARTVFESHLAPLYGELLSDGRQEEAVALDSIGAALNWLEEQIHDLQLAYAAQVQMEK